MPRPFCPALTLVGLALLASAATAQTTTVRGAVVDAESGAPVAGANVFISGSQTADAADGGGAFSFVTTLTGTVAVAASAVGYETASEEVDLDRGGAVSLTLRLAPRTILGDEAVVTAARRAVAEADLSAFAAVLLGETENAARTTIENPGVLDIRRTPDGLRASALAPLRLRNEGLGYAVTLHNLDVTGEGDEVRWTAQTEFTPIETGNRRQRRRWERARREAYEGSWIHFLRALQAGRAEREGFEVADVREPGFVLENPSPLSDRDLTDRLVHRDDGATVLVVPAAWLVAYTREDDRRAGLSRRTGAFGEAEYPPQRSWITTRPGGVEIDGLGRERNRYGAVRYGYWTAERAADLLPLDYDAD